MSRGRSLGLGNLVVADRGDVFEITLNTYNGRGHPHALFTRAELPWLAEQLKSFAGGNTVAPKPKRTVTVKIELDPEDIL